MEESKLTQSDIAAVMDFAAALGEAVMVRGGELWRVEEVINGIFHTYGLTDGGIFMLPHTLIISAGAEGLEPVMRQKNVGEILVDMEELSGLTTLIHKIHKEKPAPEKLMGMLRQGSEGKHYTDILKICGMVIALLSLNYLIGGDLIDAAFIGGGIAIAMGLDMYLSSIPGTQKIAVSADSQNFLAYGADLVQALLGIALGSMPAPMLLHSKRYIRNILGT